VTHSEWSDSHIRQQYCAPALSWHECMQLARNAVRSKCDADERAVRSIIQFGCCTHVHAANAEFGVERV
jgi:hypothetical protein